MEPELPINQIICGDCLEVVSEWPAESIHCCVTSPPYWGLRDYGVDGQLGLEKTPEEYVAKMVAVFREVKRVLRSDGTLWLNLGDSYNQGNKGQSGELALDSKQATNKGSHATRRGENLAPSRKGIAGLKPKDLCGVPWRVAFALQADGWYLRQDIIWAKPNPMPESCTDRCTKAHEYLFLLTKRPRYFYDQEAIKEPFADERMGNPNGGGQYAVDAFQLLGTQKGRSKGEWNVNGSASGRNKRSVWTVTTQAFSGGVSYGKYRIASQDCPVHDYQADRSRVQQYGEQQGVSRFVRNLGTDDRPVPPQEGVAVAIPLNPSVSLSRECVAIDRNTESHKMAMSSERDAIFYGILPCHTEYRGHLDRCAAIFDRTRGSSTAGDDVSGEKGLCPEVQTRVYIVCIQTFEKPLKDCRCYYTGKPQIRQDHFAVFPPKLIEPCILAGTSKKGCCPECGGPWERVVEKYDTGSTQKMPDGMATHAGDHGTIHKDGREKGKGGNPVMANKTTGWRPTCSDYCSDVIHDPVPCIVLDPFMGSGTVAEVAAGHERAYVGIELKQEYADMAAKRLEAWESGVTRKEADKGQMAMKSLFEDKHGS